MRRNVTVDLLRTLAIVLMVAYHTVFDLYTFLMWPVNPFSPSWILVARGAAILFLLLVGISFALSNKERTTKQIWLRSMQRSLLILFCALLISLATYFYDTQEYIRFGILHCIAVSVIILTLLRPLKEWNLVLGMVILLAGSWIQDIHGSSWLLPLGITHAGFRSLDYFPLIPWLGIVLMGFAIGSHISSTENTQETTRPRWLQAITWPGKHALIIYLLHQPVLLVLLRLFS